jgi:SAM-dependent methyltransferase
MANSTGDADSAPASGTPEAASDRARWNARWEMRSDPSEPSPWLRDVTELPGGGKVLDVAGGDGRNAVWLAERGFDVTLVDVSDTALRLARARARAAGVPLSAQRRDLAADGLIGEGWDVVLIFHYLQRDLFADLGWRLRPTGLLIASLATRRNRERHDRPPPRYLLDEGELPHLIAGLDVVRFEEGWGPEGRHEARLVARRPLSGP